MKCCLLFGSCPSTRTFARCFLQTPPCDGSPCIIPRPSPPSGWPEDFHLRAAEQCPAHNEPANAGDASRATIWQGNCHVEDQLFYSNITPAQNTVPIQYPMSNCPAKPTGSFKRLYRKARRSGMPLAPGPIPPARFRYSTNVFRSKSCLNGGKGLFPRVIEGCDSTT